MKTALNEGVRDRGLRRTVGLWAFTGSIVNGVVGAGIFALPAAMAAAAGSRATLAYLACALAMAAVVLCFAEGGSRVPTSGGAYGTVGAALGPAAGFLAGVYLWVSSVFACGGIAAALCAAIAAFLPALGGMGGRLAILAAVFGALALLNIRGAGLAARIIAAGTVVKLVPLLLFVTVGAFWLAAGHAAPATGPVPAGGDFAEAMILAIFAFSGMETPLAASGEVRDPARTVPAALLLAMLFVLLLYVAVQLVAQGLLGGTLAGTSEPLAEAMRGISPALGLVVLAGGALSRLIWIGTDIFGAPRVLFAFARDGFLPSVLGRAHPRFATPHVAILVHVAIAAFFAATGSFVRLAIWSTLATAGLYFLACAAALVLRRRGVAMAGRPLSFRLLVPAALMGMASMVAVVTVAKREEIAGFVGVTLAALLLGAPWAHRGAWAESPPVRARREPAASAALAQARSGGGVWRPRNCCRCPTQALERQRSGPRIFASPRESCSAPWSCFAPEPHSRLMTSLLSGRSLAVPFSRST